MKSFPFPTPKPKFIYLSPSPLESFDHFGRNEIHIQLFLINPYLVATAWVFKYKQ